MRISEALAKMRLLDEVSVPASLPAQQECRWVREEFKQASICSAAPEAQEECDPDEAHISLLTLINCGLLQVHDEHVREAIRIFQVSTLAASKSGMIGESMGFVDSQTLEEIT